MDELFKKVIKKYNNNYETIEIRQNLSKDLLTYKDHSRRNPVVSDVMASASTHYSLHV